MATALVNEKIIGGMGIAAVIVFVVTMFAAALMKSDFSFGTNTIGDLMSETAFVAGCVIAGVLGALFGLLITFKKAESKVFIGRVRGILLIVSGALLVILGLTNGNSWVVYLFIVMISLAAASDTFYNWVADQKIVMAFSLIFTLVIALTGILSQTSDNAIVGFLFVFFVAIWILFMALMRFAPIAEEEPEKVKKSKSKTKAKEEQKKNAPKPRPYPTKKEEAPAPKKEAAIEKPPVKEEPKKVEEPKKAEPPKAEPKKVEEPKKAEEPKPKEELPKLKVMSSREAAAARESARKKEEEAAAEPPKAEPEPVVAEPVAEPVTEPVAEPEPVVAEPVAEPVVAVPVEETESADDTDAEGFDEDFEMIEETPDALLRRATWNKGLRCRRDYGEHLIPIAFVKAKVAVYVVPEMGDTSVDDQLRSEGWTVFRYLEGDITDGKEQADEINKAVKENLRAERAAKKKKSSKK